jgi:hypothetical protein
MNKDLIFEIADEAHMMGRIYSQGGEKDSPVEEFKSVKKMVERRLAGITNSENKSKISGENEIKMQMAKDILKSFINDGVFHADMVNGDEIDLYIKGWVSISCNMSEQIFNKVGK